MTKITDSHHSVWLGRTGICKRGKLKIQSSAMPVISNEFKQITHREKTSILYTQYCLSNDRTIFQLPLSLCGKIHVSTWIKTPLICELTEMNKGLPMFMTSTNTQTHTHTHTYSGSREWGAFILRREEGANSPLLFPGSSYEGCITAHTHLV